MVVNSDEEYTDKVTTSFERMFREEGSDTLVQNTERHQATLEEEARAYDVDPKTIGGVTWTRIPKVPYQ
jgi:hypothetical protein